MKDRKRKKRDWKNDNRIMKKYGDGIHREIERTFKKTAANHIKHKTLKMIADANNLPIGAYKELSQSVGWSNN